MAVQNSAATAPEMAAASASRWWLVPLWALAGFFILAILSVITLVLWIQSGNRRAAQQLAAEVARIQAAGEPITTNDLYAFHKVPPGTADVTRLWLAILDSFNEQQFNADSKSLPAAATKQTGKRTTRS